MRVFFCSRMIANSLAITEPYSNTSIVAHIVLISRLINGSDETNIQTLKEVAGKHADEEP